MFDINYSHVNFASKKSSTATFISEEINKDTLSSKDFKEHLFHNNNFCLTIKAKFNLKLGIDLL